MNEPVIAVTENEMREFFTRLTSTIVEGTRTHKQLEELEARFKQTEERVQSLTSDLASARQEIYRTVAERDQARKEAQDNKGLADMYARDLEQTKSELSALSDQQRNLGTQLSDLGRELSTTKTMLASSETELTHTRDDRDYWRMRAFDAEETKAKVQEAYSELFKKWNELQEGFGKFFRKEEPSPLPSSPEASPTYPLVSEGSGDYSTQEQKPSQGPSPGEPANYHDKWLPDGSRNPNYIPF